MKNIIYVIALAIVTVACQPKENALSIKDETMKLHDLVMANHSKIIANQMKIDTLLGSLSKVKAQIPLLDTLAEKAALIKLRSDLVVAEDSMNNWMHQFNADFNSQLDWEVIHYYKQERDKIAKISELYKKEIKQSDTYLTKFKN